MLLCCFHKNDAVASTTSPYHKVTPNVINHTFASPRTQPKELQPYVSSSFTSDCSSIHKEFQMDSDSIEKYRHRSVDTALNNKKVSHLEPHSVVSPFSTSIPDDFIHLSSSTLASMIRTPEKQLSIDDDLINVPPPTRGMSRSSASYAIQHMLKEQIELEEAEDAKKINEESEYQKSLTDALSSLSASYEEKMRILKFNHEKQLEDVILKERNRHEKATEAIISAIRSDTERLKREYETELEKQKHNFESQLRQLEDSHRLSTHDCLNDKNYDLVVSKVQQEKRISTEKLLTNDLDGDEESGSLVNGGTDTEDHQGSQTKSQSRQINIMQKEIESLRMVVEIRTEEIHRLRAEVGRMHLQGEKLSAAQNKIQKLTARVEDLQEVLKHVNKRERQLSLEKSHLEDEFKCEVNDKARISLQVEELQWRLKENLRQSFNFTTPTSSTLPSPIPIGNTRTKVNHFQESVCSERGKGQHFVSDVQHPIKSGELLKTENSVTRRKSDTLSVSVPIAKLNGNPASIFYTTNSSAEIFSSNPKDTVKEYTTPAFNRNNAFYGINSSFSCIGQKDRASNTLFQTNL